MESEIELITQGSNFIVQKKASFEFSLSFCVVFSVSVSNQEQSYCLEMEKCWNIYMCSKCVSCFKIPVLLDFYVKIEQHRRRTSATPIQIKASNLKVRFHYCTKAAFWLSIYILLRRERE